MSANKEETLRQFCDVTGADESRSKFFLESSNWQLDVALSSFYEHGGSADEAPANPTAAAVSSMPILSDMDSDMDSPPGSPVCPQKKQKDKKNVNTKFATLDSLQQESSSDEEEDPLSWIKPSIISPDTSCCDGQCGKTFIESPVNEPNIQSDRTYLLEEIESLKVEVDRLTKENCELKKEMDGLTKENCELRKEISSLKESGSGANETGQAFYAGGSERSGQQILGPGKGRKDIVTEVFKSVRERGAVVFEDEPSTAGRGRGAFSGVGYRLGQTADDHEEVTPTGRQPQEQARSVRLRLYREGFSVDGGPLRSYTDPEHADFLNCIRRGEIPPELASTGAEVRVSLEDRRHEPSPRSVTKSQAFAGAGHMLGSPTPTVTGAPAPVASAASDRSANQLAAQDALRIDDAKPVTTIQFRLADGSRLTGRFNHSHTIADLHQYVSRAEPAYQLTTFTLLTTFPSQELTDHAASLADAKILNSTLLQRLK